MNDIAKGLHMTPETATERAALVTWLLVQGGSLSTREVARRTGLGIRGASYLCDRLSMVLPIVLVDGRWQLVNEGKPSHLTR